MKKIPLTNGGFALVDDEDFEKLLSYPWCRKTVPNSQLVYAVYTASISPGNRQTVWLHRMILGATKGQLVDHRDGDGLNNTKTNLRFCTHSENCRNKKIRSDSKTGTKGVTRNKSHGKETGGWLAQIGVNGRGIRLGVFGSKKEAAIAYQNAAKRLHGEFARFQ